MASKKFNIARRVLESVNNPRHARSASSREVERFMQSPIRSRVYQGGDLLFTTGGQKNTKLIKLEIQSLNDSSLELDKRAKSNYSRSIASLNEMRRELESLHTEIQQEEVKHFGGLDKVHINNFSRSEDASDVVSNIRDPKTNIAFSERNKMTYIEGAGLTMPVQGTTTAPLEDVRIVSEDTDSGSTRVPLQQTSPRNLILPNRTFHYTIIEKEQSIAQSLSKKGKSNLVLEVEFSNKTQINYLELEPMSEQDIEVASVSYWDTSIPGAPTYTLLKTTETPSTALKTVFFYPVSTKRIKIHLRQKTPVGRTTATRAMSQEAKANEMLESIGFTSRLEEESVNVVGRIYDFSIKRLACGRRTFASLGVFKSGTALRVDGPIGFDVSWGSDVSHLFAGSEEADPIDAASFIEKNAAFEFYLEAALYGGDARPGQDGSGERALAFQGVIPVPDTGLIQYEYLVPHGRMAKLKLFPEIKDRSILNLPTVKRYRDGDEATLQFPQDFHVSLDNGESWVTSQDELSQAVDNNRGTEAAFRFQIRLMENPLDYDVFTATYPILRNQRLTPRGEFMLRNGVVTASRELQASSGIVKTIIVSRETTPNPYVCAILKNFYLKATESKENSLSSNSLSIDLLSIPPIIHRLGQ